MLAKNLLEAAGNSSQAANYIEDVFSTYLYTGNGSTQTITNGIDLAGKGGMVWNKPRTAAMWPYGTLTDTVRGANRRVIDSLSSAEATNGPLSAFNSDGFTINSGFAGNTSSDTYASWTFRKQPKFFDVVTYTGNGANRTIAHSLGSVPGCIIVKRTDTTGDWQVYHQSLANTEYMVLNSTAAKATGATRWNSTTPTSTVFSLGIDASVNASGGTYVAYLFAHNAGGFGATGTDNVISCGSCIAPTSGNTTSVNLGYEPQWILVKDVTASGSYWITVDNMRGASVTSNAYLYPNTSGAEEVYGTSYITPTATGFTMKSDLYTGGNSVIYIAIRRGPMKVPTDGTKVFAPVARTGTGSTAIVTAGFPPDLVIPTARTVGFQRGWYDRLRGPNQSLASNSTGAELTTADSITVFGQDSATFGTENSVNIASYTFANWFMRRAPGFFDEVCYTGTGSNATIPHNLTVAPEFFIVKSRSSAYEWWCYHSALGNTQGIRLNTTGVSLVDNVWNNTSPTANNFYIANNGYTSATNQTFVAYLFATCPGVSKVFSFTGNGSSQTINCGFTGGSRFILIKCTSTTGDWYVWDTARGIVSGTDPHLSLNTTAAEVTTDDTIDPDSSGFIVNQVAATNVNVNGATYIGIAIA